MNSSSTTADGRCRGRSVVRTGRKRAALVLVAAMLAAPGLSPGAAEGVSEGTSQGFSRDGGLNGIDICHGFGCRIKETVSISGKEWSEIKAFFSPSAATAAQEREQIKRATGWFEVIAGRHTPIHRDRGKNDVPAETKSVSLGPDDVRKNPGSTIGQMDCIDESLNTTTYLRAMDRAGLFKYHRAVERAHRQSALDQHYAGQIEEMETGTRWVVDSWFYDYGSLPYLEEAEEWHDIPFLFGTSFPE